jgi:hypothetical protein
LGRLWEHARRPGNHIAAPAVQAMSASEMRSEATAERHRGCAFLIWLGRRLWVQNPALKTALAAAIPTWIALHRAGDQQHRGQTFHDASGRVSATPASIRTTT